MEYYQKIKKEFINNNTNKEVKEYYRNINDLQVYYNVGKLLSIELSKSNLEAKELIDPYCNHLNYFLVIQAYLFFLLLLLASLILLN